MTSRLLTAVTTDGLLKEAFNSLIMEEPATYNFKSKSSDSDDDSDDDEDDNCCNSDDDSDCEDSCDDDKKKKKKKSGWLPAPIVYPILLAGQIF